MFMQHPGFFNVSTCRGAEMLTQSIAEVNADAPVFTEKGIEYLNVPAAFDTETSSFIRPEDGKKCAIMYIWQIGLNGYAFYGRTWAEFEMIMDVLRNGLTLSPRRRLVIYVHNLMYDFQFIKNRFHFIDMFCIRRRKPIYAVTDIGIEFRCSYIESGYALSEVGKNLTKYPVRKMVGDLYYNVIRHSETLLSRKELKYCENDIRVVMSHIQEEIEINGDITQIPKTNTGRVRTYTRNHCYENPEYDKMIKKLRISGNGDAWKLPDCHQYEMLQNAYRGGVVQANPFAATGSKVYENVTSKDIASSYPAVMCSELYPMSKGRKIEIDGDPVKFKWVLTKKCSVFSIHFVNLHPRRWEAFYLNACKCFDFSECPENAEYEPKSNWILENGNVVDAPDLWTTITNVDFSIIQKNYKWDSIEILECYVYDKDYLPKEIIECCLEFYGKKTELKDIPEKIVEYFYYKGLLNSEYGMIATNIIRDKVNFNFDESQWEPDTPANVEKELSDYNRGYKRFLFYPWAVFVTAYARQNLFKSVFALGDDFLYCDTDCSKYRNGSAHESFFEQYNADITAKINACLDHYGIDRAKAAPLDKNGKPHPLGVYCPDGDFKRFKTLGAKRYMCLTDDGYELTCAGVPKESGMKMILRKAKNENKDPFDIFRVGLTFSGKSIGHTASYYIDEHLTGKITDYKGNECEYDELSGIYMEPSDYILKDTLLMTLFTEYCKGFTFEIAGSAT